ncbi:Hypothetical protein HDN1F_34590 [gamma proteobacterium HdN1]|nr:Hypothetical protein HDN1F_34590 [gamma proteobacterium HdN1]
MLQRPRIFALKPLVVAASFSCLILAGCSEKNPTSNTSAQTQEQAIARAQAYEDQGQFRAAIIEARNVLQKAPNDPAALVLISGIYTRLGDGKQALNVFNHVDTQANPALFLAQIDAMIRRGKVKTAEEHLAKPPQNLSATQQELIALYRTQIAAQNGQISQASEGFEKLKKSKNPEIHKQATLGRIVLALRSGAHDEVEKLLAAALQENPEFTEALIIKASIASEADNLDQAEELLSHALMTLPATDMITEIRANVLTGLANVLTRQGHTAEALIYTRMLADARPGADNAKEQFAESLELLKAGNLQEAEQKLMRLYQQYNEPDAAGRLLGVIRMREGDLEGAEQYFSQHIDPETASPEALRVLAENQLRLNKVSEAMHLLEANLSRSPEDADLLGVYGLAALANGQSEKGLEALQKALKIAPSKTGLRATLAQYYLQKGDAKSAIDQLEKAIKQAPSELALRGQLVQIYLREKNLDAVKNQAAQIEKDFATNADGLAAAGSIYTQLGAVKQAKPALEKALSLEPTNPNALTAMVILELKGGDLKKARSYAETIINTDPNSLRAFRLLVNIHARENTLDAFVKQLQHISDERINAWGADATLSDYFRSKGDLTQALKHIKEALARSGFQGYPKLAATQLYALITKAQLRQGDMEAARKSLMEGLQNDGNSLELLNLLALTEIESGKYAEAQKIVTQIQSAHPNSQIPDLLRADLLIAQGDKDAARNALQKLWSANPTDGVAIRLGGLLETQAQDDFSTEWTTKLPSSVEAWLRLGLRKQAQNDQAAAERAYSKVIELRPTEARALNNLAWIRCEKGDLKSAEELAERAVASSPNDAAVLDTYGWILLKAGKKADAQKMLKKAHELAPQIEEIKQHYEEASR